MSESRKAVFLSYASQDADAARRIADALRGAGIEVWFDQSELVGGDAWDAKIRRQIASCALFLPIISANTQARLEGYFRIEWKLAAQRTHAMAEAKPFLVPIVIDATRDAESHVPGEFKSVQWTRLAAGETSPAFCERVRKLLEGEVGARPPSAAGSPMRPGAAALPGKPRRWLLPVMATLAVAIAGFAIFNPKPQTQNPKPTASPPPALSSSNASEARQLTLKARALIDDDLMAVRENYRLAEELCQRAVTLDPSDGEAWATLARASREMIFANYDTTTTRREAARSQAERAIRLAPNSIEAGLAIADYHSATGDLATSENRLRDLVKRAPQDARVALSLATVLSRRGQVAEARDILRDHPALGERHARALVIDAGIVRGQGRYREGDEIMERAHRIAPSKRGYLLMLLSLLDWGDLDAARALAEKLPAQILQEDSFASHVARTWVRLGEGNRALEILSRVPREFFEEGREIFPKGYLAGRAQQVSGRQAAADSEWKAALAVVDKRLATDPNRAILLRWKAVLLALTGQKQEAERTLKLFEELRGSDAILSRRSDDPRGLSLYRAELLLALDRTPEAVAEILAVPQWAGDSPLWTLTTLQYDPWFAPLRSDPRVQAIITAADARRKALRQDVGKVATPAEPARPPADAKSVAVLAFKNSSDDKGNEYFSDGISEELLNVLAKVPGLKVSARTSAFHFKGKDTPIPEIARQLGVAHVVEGSVQKVGNRVRIKAQLIKAADGFQVWSESFERELKDIFALQDEIAGLIAKNLSLKLGGGAIAAARLQTRNLAAYDAYLRGRALHTGGLTIPKQREMTGLYAEAVRIDESYALAWARHAQGYLWLVSSGQDRSPPTVANARQAAETSVRLAPDLPEARLALAGIHHHVDRNHAAAERELDAAERLQANNPEVFAARARLEFARGNWGPGLVELVMRSVELDPQNAEPHDFGAFILYELGRFAEADQLCRRHSAIAPTLFRPRFRQCEIHLAWTGDTKEALAVVAGIVQERSEVPSGRGPGGGRAFLAELPAIYEAAGDFPSAIAVYESVQSERRSAMSAYRLARLEAKRGNQARATELLDEAVTFFRQQLAQEPNDFVAASALPLLHAARKQKPEAMAAMEQAIQLGMRNTDARRAAYLREVRAEMLALLGEAEAAVAELRGLHEKGWGFGYMLGLALAWEPLRGNEKFDQLRKEAEARADAQPRFLPRKNLELPNPKSTIRN